eukprot:1839363-Pyramimonas_sp.AAC.1
MPPDDRRLFRYFGSVSPPRTARDEPPLGPLNSSGRWLTSEMWHAVIFLSPLRGKLAHFLAWQIMPAIDSAIFKSSESQCF